MKYISILLIFLTTLSHSQPRNSDTENKSKDPIVQSIVDEANNNSQLEVLAHELFDVIGPRLVGTPQMKQAHDWAVKNIMSGELRLTIMSGENGEAGKEE